MKILIKVVLSMILFVCAFSIVMSIISGPSAVISEGSVEVLIAGIVLSGQMTLLYCLLKKAIDEKGK